MKMIFRSNIRATILVAGVALSIAMPSAAAAEDQFVYRPLLTDGTEYRRIAYPREAGSLLVLADTDMVIEARRVPVSYWPITREYLADFSGGPPPVEGAVEILDASGGVRVVDPVPYVMWHPEGVGAGPVQLLYGEESERFYEGYVKRARAAAAKAKEYQRIVAERQAAVEAWLRIAAERPPDLPKPPPELEIAEPEPFHAFASEPRLGAVTALPEGTYTVRVRGSDGDVVPGSERELVSFAPRAHAVGYVLRPQDRWTRPIVSFSPLETVYTTDGTDLFFQPVPVAEYEARRFTRLFRPQSVETADPSLTVWTPRPDDGHAIAGAALVLSEGDTVVETLPRTPYRVSQLPGASRGFSIGPFKPEAGSTVEPDFYAMRIGKESGATRVSLVGASGPVPASARRIRHVSPPSGFLLFLPALLPLAVGVAVRLRCRRR